MSGTISPGAIDASIPLRAGQGVTPVQNPLDALGKFSAIQNQLNVAKLFPEIAAQQRQKTLNEQQSASFGLLAPMLAKPPEQWTHKDITDLAALGEARGYVTQPLLAHLAAAPSADGVPLATYLRPFIASQMQTEATARLGAVVPTTALQSNGQAIVPVNIAPAGGPAPGAMTTPGGFLPTYPPRSELITRVPGPPGPRGEPTTVPLGTITPPELSGINLGTGRIRDTVPPALRNPNAPPMPGATLPGQITTGVGPAAQNQMATSGTNSAQRFQTVADEAAQANEQNAVLANMQNDLKNFTSGPGAHNYQQLQKVIQGWGPGLEGAWKTKIAAQESFDKLANQLVTTAAPGSDARQAVIQGANPNSAQSPEGVDFILRQLRGVADYKIARSNIAAAAADKTDYPGWQSAHGNKLNPQVFQFARLTSDQQKLFLKGIPEKERDQFKQQYLDAQKAGFYGVDNGG